MTGANQINHPADEPAYPASIYRDAVLSIREERAARAARFDEIRSNWERFYSLADTIGRVAATDELPEDAGIVAEFENWAADSTLQSAVLHEALCRTLEIKVRSLAEVSVEASETSVLGRLRQDLLELQNWRLINVDGIGGSFWDVVKHGHGSSKNEKGRLINRILSAWCEVYSVAPATMNQAALPFSNFTPGEVESVQGVCGFTKMAKDFPFEIVPVLIEARGWDEIDPTSLDMLVDHYALDMGLANGPATGSFR